MATVTSKALQPFSTVDVAAQLCTVVETVRRLDLVLHILLGQHSGQCCRASICISILQTLGAALLHTPAFIFWTDENGFIADAGTLEVHKQGCAARVEAAKLTPHELVQIDKFAHIRTKGTLELPQLPPRPVS